MLELAVGRRLRTNAVGAFRCLDQRFEIAGWLLATVVFTILSYYLVITGWTLAYFVRALAGEMQPFGEFTSGYAPLVAFAVSGIATGAVTSLGVRQGIERVATVLMPLAFLILVGLAIYGSRSTASGKGRGSCSRRTSGRWAARDSGAPPSVDDTVGRLGLPLGALIIAFFFTRRLPQAAILEEFGSAGGRWSLRQLLLSLLRWTIPVVLLVVTASSAIVGLDLTAWGVLPGIAGMRGLSQLLATGALGAALLASTLVVVRLLRMWQGSRRNGP